MALTEEQKREKAQKQRETIIEAITGKPLAWYSDEGANRLKSLHKIEEAIGYKLPSPEDLAKEPDLPDWLDAVPDDPKDLAVKEAELEAEYWTKDEEFWESEEAPAFLEAIIENRKALGWPELNFDIEGSDPEPETDNKQKAYDLELDNLSDSDYAATLAACEKAHPNLPPSNGKRNGVGLRYDHRYDDCAFLTARERNGLCTVNRTACPLLSGNQKQCQMYQPFRNQIAGAKVKERNVLYPRID